MFVINRKNQHEPIRYDKITDRNIELSVGLNVNPSYLSKLVIESLKDGMTTTEIDELSAETAFYMSTYEPDYDVLATRISVSNLHKQTSSSFYETVKKMWGETRAISDSFMSYVEANASILDSKIDYTRDYNYNYFGFKTLCKMYLNKINSKTVERPQHMLMRVAVCIHSGNMERILESYEEMSKGKFTHASPTLFNSGSSRPQLASCFLLKCEDDLEHIYETNKRSALISKHGGGIGIDITNVRPKGSVIHSTNGKSDGIVPMCKVFNSTALYSNQCFHPNTKIVCLKNNVPISEIKVGDFVWSGNESFKGGYAPVVDIFINNVDKEILEITTNLGCIKVTKEHQLYRYIDDNTIEFISADGLYEGDKVPFLGDNGVTDFSTIINIKTVFYKGPVYDLSVLNNNSYTVEELGLVHNSGRRKGSIAMYLQPWHPDVFDFLALRYNNPPEELRARDLFTAMWVPDIFMRRVEADEMWSLIDPNVVRELCDTYGEEFDRIYENAEKEGKVVRRVKAREVFKEILHSQQETGLPYISYKDSVNRKSNQKNIGLIRSSNLCNEINEFTDTDSVSVCNLSSLSLPSFVKERDGRKYFDFNDLARITKIAVRNLNKVIDITYYPIVEAERNNLAYRPIGLGIQGLADVFAMFKLPWGSGDATKLNSVISEVMYYYALEASHEISLEEEPYSAFEGSPISRGEFQFDMWGVEPKTREGVEMFGDFIVLDWEKLREKVKKGVRNSLLIALMPTATSSQILNNNECFEAFTSNIYTRSTMAGDFVMVNKHLAKDLKEMNLWSKDLVNKIIENNGSVQSLEEIPKYIRDIYKTVWEIPQKIVIDYAADRGAFVDQSQSMNIFIDKPTYAKLSSMHLYGWKKGLKTGSYYIRSKPSKDAVKFSILRDKGENREKDEKRDEKEGKKYILNGKEMVCTDDVCTMCSA